MDDRTITAPPPPGTGALARLADVAYRRRGRVLLAWIALLAVVLAVGPRLTGEYDEDYSTPGSESEAAAALLADRFGDTSGDTIDVVWQARDGVRSPAAAATMDRFLVRAARLEGVGRAAGPPQVSADGTIAVARLPLDRRSWDVPDETSTALVELAETTSGDGLRIELAGGTIGEEGNPPEVLALVAAAAILLIAFGSIVAAGLPLLTALFGLGISATLIGVVAAVIDVPDWAPAVAGLLGIGVGIDYALLILTRFRTALATGADRRAAVVEAVETAGRSVLVAGTTVVISILGLLLVGIPSLRGVAVSAALAVLVVMLASVTLLPALLAFLGTGVNRLHVPGLGRSLRGNGGAAAARWSKAVQRRPWAAAIAGTAILLVLAAPALGLRLGFPDAGNSPEGSTTREAYDLTSEGFGPGATGPLFVVADLAGADAASLDGLAERLRSVPGVASAGAPALSPARDAALLIVTPTTSPQDAATADLVHRLRENVLPQATAGRGITTVVGGQTAAFVDESDLVTDRLPLFVAAVVGLSLLLILAVFRSPALALKAGIFNLLSVGAAYGVLALFAEGGLAGSLIGIDTDTPVPSAIPVIMFAILFGLSMDYEVFLLSRVREEYLRHGDSGRAVVDGVARTARVITAAAAIMVVVFLAFVGSTEVFLKLMGVGMATAILVDATVVRMLLVPAVMQLMGRATWWIPRRLDRILPRVDVEPAVPARR